jgi:pilus assembly protein Flp/PilA
MERVKRFFRDEEGVTAIEYGLIAAAIATVLIAVMAWVSDGLTTVFTRISNALV